MSPRAKTSADEFLAEAQDVVEAFGEAVAALDRSSERNPELVNDCFRHIHTLKGLAAVIDHERLSNLSHTVEAMLDAMRLGRRPVDSEAIDVLYRAVDAIIQLLDAGVPVAVPPSVSELIERAASITPANPAPTTTPSVADPLAGVDPALVRVLNRYQAQRVRDSLGSGRLVALLRTKVGLEDVEAEVERLRGRVADVAEVIAILPSGDITGVSALGIDLLLTTTDDLPMVRLSLARRIGSGPFELQAVTGRSTTPALPEPLGRVRGRKKRDTLGEDLFQALRSLTHTVRVDVSRLDALTAAVSELGHVHAALRADTKVDRVDALDRLDSVVRRLHTELLALRMVRLAPLFDKLHRVGRTLGKRADVEVELEFEGGDTVLDKVIVDDLSDPLLHVLRNAIDHGIEPADVRQAAGKPRAGRISIEATAVDGSVVLAIHDDGRGVDLEAAKKAALARELVDASELDTLSERQQCALLFLPGMSTRPQATEMSGRGVGLDVVRAHLARLGGLIDMTTTRGQGTELRFTLPVTRMVTVVRPVTVAARCLAIPLVNAVDALTTRPGATSIEWRGERLAVLSLAEMLGESPAGSSPTIVLVLGVAEHRIGIAVDDIGESMSVVLDPASTRESGSLIAGHALLAGGVTAEVLDPAAIVEAFLAHDWDGGSP